MNKNEEEIIYNRGYMDALRKMQEFVDGKIEIQEVVLASHVDEFNKGDLSPEKQAEAEAKGYEGDV